MNIDILISWGCKMLTFLDQPQPSAEFDRQKVITKLGWVSSFRQQLKEWRRAGMPVERFAQVGQY